MNVKNYISKKVDQFNNFKWYMLFMVVVGLFFILLNYTIVMIGDEIQNVNYAIGLGNHVKDNELNLPLPFMSDSSLNGYLKTFNQDIHNFKDIIDNNYIYTLDKYDCKYWSYVWTLWFKNNKDKYNLNIKYITTSNHIFVMVYNDSGYCTLDLFEANCYGKMFSK